MRSPGGEFVSMCHGELVAPKLVLTAAHCLVFIERARRHGCGEPYASVGGDLIGIADLLPSRYFRTRIDSGGMQHDDLGLVVLSDRTDAVPTPLSLEMIDVPEYCLPGRSEKGESGSAHIVNEAICGVLSRNRGDSSVYTRTNADTLADHFGYAM